MFQQELPETPFGSTVLKFSGRDTALHQRGTVIAVEFEPDLQRTLDATSLRNGFRKRNHRKIRSGGGEFIRGNNPDILHLDLRDAALRVGIGVQHKLDLTQTVDPVSELEIGIKSESACFEFNVPERNGGTFHRDPLFAAFV